MKQITIKKLIIIIGIILLVGVTLYIILDIKTPLRNNTKYQFTNTQLGYKITLTSDITRKNPPLETCNGDLFSNYTTNYTYDGYQGIGILVCSMEATSINSYLENRFPRASPWYYVIYAMDT